MFARRAEAGYNLIELLMAMALTSIVFMSITSLYTYQAQSITAQNNVLTTSRDARFALEHLRRDLMSLGSNATPNSVVDDLVCPKPAVDIRALVANTTEGHVVRPDLNPALRKLSLTFFGSLDVKTRFTTESITGKIVKLVDDGSLPATPALWDDTFSSDRFLRLSTADGKSMVLAIASASHSDHSVTLAEEPPQLVGAQRCGYQGVGDGLAVDVQGFVRYPIVADTRPTAPVDGNGDPARTLLVRERLATDGKTVHGALPLAENVVELGLYDVGYDANPNADAVDMQLLPLIDDMVQPDGSGVLGDSLSARPEALRFATVKISVRADVHQRGLAHASRKQKYLPLMTYKLDADADGAAPVTTVGGRVTMPAMVSRNL